MASNTVFMVALALLLAPLMYTLISIIRFIKSWRRRTNAVLQWPGPPRHWFWGTMHLIPLFDPKIRASEFLDAQLDFLIEDSAKFPRGRYEFFTNLKPMLLFNHPVQIRQILKRGDPKPCGFGGGLNYNFLRTWLGDGLLVARGKKWARNRRLLTPAFHFDILKPYIDVYNKGVNVLLIKMDNLASDGSSFEVSKHISLCTLDILLKCAFSQNNNCQIDGDHHPYVTAVRDLSLSLVNRFSTALHHFDFVYHHLSRDGRKYLHLCDFVHQVADDVITKRRQGIETLSEQPDRKYLDFLDILLSARDKDGQGLTDLEIRDEVDTFLFEGHDTVASALTWTLYSLAKYPEHQKKAQQEIDTIMDAKVSDEIDWDDLAKLKYLTLCIKESLRMYPPVAMISRTMENDTEVEGKIIPAGVEVDVFIYALHHNPEVWEDHMEFRPDRFLPENIQKQDPFAFLPFSAGPRNCIGQNFAMNEMKVMLACILKRFDMTLDPNHEVHFAREMLLKPAGDIKLKLKRRR